MKSKTGFSLTELLIAVSILGIGLAMIAALFATGLMQTGEAVANSRFINTAQNGVEVAELFLKEGDIQADVFGIVADGEHTEVIPADHQVTPCQTESKRGFATLGRIAAPGAYQIAVLPFQKQAPGNYVAFRTLVVAVDSTNALDVIFTSTLLRPSSPIVFANPRTGSPFAQIVSCYSNVARLNHPVTVKKGDICFVVREYTIVDGNPVPLHDSPATGVHLARIGIRPATP